MNAVLVEVRADVIQNDVPGDVHCDCLGLWMRLRYTGQVALWWRGTQPGRLQMTISCGALDVRVVREWSSRSRVMKSYCFRQ